MNNITNNITTIVYTASLIPLAIGLTSTNKVEGIVKAIVGLLITFLPYIYLYFFSNSFNWSFGGPTKEEDKGKQLAMSFMFYSTIYTLVAYISVIIMMLKTTN